MNKVIVLLVLVIGAAFTLRQLEKQSNRVNEFRRAAEVVEWNTMQAYGKMKQAELDRCIAIGGVPITEPLSSAKLPYFKWTFPPSALNLVRCDFPAVITPHTGVEK